jgi:hypothetical protein
MYWCNLILQALMNRTLGKVGASMYCHSSLPGMGRDLPDADGPGFVSLNGGFGEANRSLIGHFQSFEWPRSLPLSSLSPLAVR